MIEKFASLINFKITKNEDPEMGQTTQEQLDHLKR